MDKEITILEISQMLEEAKTAIGKECQETDYEEWRPMIKEDAATPELILPKLTKPNRAKWSKVFAFIELNQNKRAVNACTIMPIPTTNKRLISICGSQREVSRLIDFMKECHLIEIEDDNYSFNNIDKSLNKCKLYRYYYDNEIKIKEYCQENGINKFIIKNVYKKKDNNNNNNDEENIEDNKINNNILSSISRQNFISSFKKSEVRFSSQLQLLKPDNYSVAKFEEYLTQCLYENYPWLYHYQELADEINDKFYADEPDLTLVFMPTFTWSAGHKAVRKIGIRCTNSLCSAKKDESKNIKYRGMNYAKEEYKEAVNTEMIIYKKAVEIAEGDHLYDNEIFFHESCIYMNVLYELLNLGFFVWQCYDAFYAKKGNVEQEEFENLVSEIVAEKANSYMKG